MARSSAGRSARARTAAEPGSTSLHQWLHVVILAMIVLVNLVQRPGVTTFDTKLDLTENPVGFMQDAFRVWNPSMDMGSLQNQAYGYFFPVAPFFALGDAIGAPMWLWQRLWSALLMVVAYLGMRALAKAVGGIGPGAAVLAGLSYAMAPRILMTVGVLTGESLPAAILPFTVLPLVHAWHGRLSRRRAAVYSAATVPFMSGLNATEVICALVLPGLIILCAPLAWRDRLRWGGLWGALLGAVCLWWIGPLLILGRYAPPFLNYIESARNTTLPMSWLTVARGNDHWLAFLPVEDSNWQTGHALTYTWYLVLASTLIGGVGLIGLCGRRFPMRRPFLIAAAIAMIMMALGHGGITGAPLAEPFRAFLDGAGAPFRNIHKFDPVARVGVSLGLALVVVRLRERAETRTTRLSRIPAAVRRRAPMGVALGLVGLLGFPALAGQLRADDGWTEIPQPWRQMERTLEALPDSSRVLLLPGSGFADQTWGRTVDELPQTFKGVNWASRTQVPLVSPGGIRLLESIEERMSTGRPSDALAPMLAQAGFTHVLVRNDMNAEATDVPSAARLHNTLRTSSGFSEGASYGSSGDGYPMLELYSLTGSAPRARAVAVSGLRELAGEADQLLSLNESGVLAQDEVTVGRSSGLSTSSGILTEGAERRERNFGRVHDAISAVRSTQDPWEQQRAAHDYGAIDTERLTSVDYGPIRRIEASSSADEPSVFGALRRDQSPWAALDGTASTQFRTAPYSDPRGQYLQLDLRRRQAIGTMRIQMGSAGLSTARVTSLRVSTDAGSRVVRVPEDGAVTVTGLGGATDHVRVEVSGVSGLADAGQIAIADISFTGLKPTRTEQIAATADAGTTMSFRTWPGRAACVTGLNGVVCEPGQAMGAEEAGGLARRVQVTESGRWQISGLVRVSGGDAVNTLLRPPGKGIVATASSTFENEPLTNPMRAVDGSVTTGWASSGTDSSPWINLAWNESRSLTRVDLSKGQQVPGGPPTVIGALVDGKPVRMTPQGGGWTFPKGTKGTSMRLYLAPNDKGAVGIGEVDVPTLRDLVYKPSDTYRTSVPCGFGPDVSIDGRSVQTRVSGTIGDLLSGKAMDVIPCTSEVAIAAGSHRLEMKPANGFQPVGLTFTPTGFQRAPVHDLPLAATTWGDEHRSVNIGGTEQALLTIPENINDGWTATLNGQKLKPVTVDGWKQGFVVPAGSNREVDLRYRPGTTYRWILIIGALLVLMVWAAAGYLRFGRSGGRVVSAAPAGASSAGRGGSHLATAPTQPPRRAVTLGLVAGVMLVLVLFGGVPVGLGFAAGVALHRRRAWVQGGVLVALIASAISFLVSTTSDVTVFLTDATAGAAFGAVLALAFNVNRTRDLRRKGRSDE
ncbi:alpha-(1-_3)-arabinofuranosyltransferase domain-containing protein [Dermacoccaceae bacterium W4C1]